VKRIPFAVLLSTFLTAVPARAAERLGTRGSGWWLPTDYARHGVAIDSLFNWIFWISLFFLLLVHLVLILFLIRYRHRAGGKARFSTGSIRMELLWTVIPTVILAGLALASAKVWDGYRYTADESNPANILVIGQQFKWNIIYPGKDGRFGRYLLFPKPTDRAWPHKPGDEQRLFMGVPGPASLPYAQAVTAIDQYIAQDEPEYQLGKDMADPAGTDDDYQDALGRTLFLPVDRPVHIEVLSRDVIHDFFLPNFRVQLYAVPGMVGSITFTPTRTTAQIEAPTRRMYSLDELAALVTGAEYRLAADDRIVSAAVVGDLKATGAASVMAYRPAHLEAVCNQLCGVGHSQMKTEIVILSQAEYHRRFE
jgi:cytochrome c oxidase subunit 2